MNVRKNPLISVVITNYNYGEYLREAIESVLNQTYKKLEIILIDDASTDNSREIYEKYREKIQIIKHKKNRGIVFSRNEALETVKGEYMCFLDADDYIDADYVEKMYEIAKKNNSDVVYPNWRRFGVYNDEFNFSEFDIKLLQLQEINCSPNSLILMKTVGKYRFESEKVAEDWDFFIGLSLRGIKFKLGEDCYINYRIHEGSRGGGKDEYEDLREFVSILLKWKEKYNDKVIEPSELMIKKIMEKNILIKKILKDNEKEIKKILIDVDNKIKDVTKKSEEKVLELKNSSDYKLGKKVLSPIRTFKKIIKGGK